MIARLCGVAKQILERDIRELGDPPRIGGRIVISGNHKSTTPLYYETGFGFYFFAVQRAEHSVSKGMLQTFGRIH